jgi:hypothetical protein
MTNLMRATAHESEGRWVVDCPNGCGNAWRLEPGEKDKQCYLPPVQIDNGRYTKAIGCMTAFHVDWPYNPEDLFAGRRAAMSTAAQAHARYVAEARRERDAQNTDDEGNPGDGVKASNARYAKLKKAAERAEKSGADNG